MLSKQLFSLWQFKRMFCNFGKIELLLKIHLRDPLKQESLVPAISLNQLLLILHKIRVLRHFLRPIDHIASNLVSAVILLSRFFSKL